MTSYTKHSPTKEETAVLTFFAVHPWFLRHVSVGVLVHYFPWYKYLFFIAVRWSFHGLCKGF